MPTVAAIAAVASVGISYTAAEDQKSATKKQIRAQSKQKVEQKKLSDIKAARERRKLFRERRKAEAEIAVATGGEGGSRAAGVGASVVTQAASAAGFGGQQAQISQSIFELGLEASRASSDIAGAQSLGQIGAAFGTVSSVALNKSVQNLSIFK